MIRIQLIFCLKGLKSFNTLVNNTDTDEILRYVTFHLGFHCLPKYPITVFLYKNVKRYIGSDKVTFEHTIVVLSINIDLNMCFSVPIIFVLVEK